MVSVLLWGSKEFPLGCNKGEDIYPSGGIEKAFDLLAPKLAENNIDVSVITRRFAGNSDITIPNIKIIKVPWIKGRYFRGPSYNLFSFLVLLKNLILYKDKYDIILSSGVIGTFFAGIYSAISSLIFRGKKPVLMCRFDVIAYKQLPEFKIIFYPLENFTYKFLVDYFIFKAESEKRLFIKNFGFNPPSFITGQIIDIDKFDNIRKAVDRILSNSQGHEQEMEIPNYKIHSVNPDILNYIKNKEKFRIIYAGRLEKTKGIQYLIKAVKDLDVELWIVGDGKYRKVLEKLTNTMKLNHRIKFFGYVKDAEYYIAISDLFVLPSFAEGVPNSVLEAMALKIPVIVTDIGLPFDDIALKVKPGNSEELREKIVEIKDNKSLRTLLAKKAYIYVKNNFSVKKVVDNYISAIDSAKNRKIANIK